MNILMTGATGFIGKVLVTNRDSVDQFTILTRDIFHAKSTLGESHTYIHSLDELKDLNDFDAVINLAGEPIVNKRWSDSQKCILESSRWEITQKLVELIATSISPPKVMISGSAIGYYGRQGDEAIDEDFDHCYDEFSHHLCKKWEQIASQAQSQDTRVCILRTGIVLGDGGALNKMLLPFKLGLGGPIASGKQYMSWIHIDDMVGGIIHLLENDSTSGVYNLTAPTPVDNKTFSKTLAKVLHRPCIFPMPAFVLRIMMGEMADLLLYGQNVVPKRLDEAGFVFHFPELEPAMQDILNKG